jgi:hypothetical protein
LFPRDGATLREVSWISLAACRRHGVLRSQVVTADGDLIQETKTEDTHLRIAGDIQLVPGGKYFISIRAHVMRKTVKSRS